MMRFALLGDPVAHSKSPAMHAAAYRASGLTHTYEAIRATPADLADLVSALRRGEYAGFNVTVPHKQRILSLVDDVDPVARAIGAANTLVRRLSEETVVPGAATVRAYNTDVPALAEELRRLAPERTPEEWARSRAVVIGSGGAARSAVAARAGELHVGEIALRARRASPLSPSEALPFVYEPRAASDGDARTVTVVQATSAGMTGAEPGEDVANALAWEALPANAVALDVVYAPLETPFLRAARTHGIRATNGIGMLARQGALAFELWLGVPAPYNAMLTALV